MSDRKIVFRFLNVGQGESTHIILPNGHHMLVDCNLDHKNRGINVTEYLSDELPKENGKKTLAFLVNTHPHDDHIRGMGDVNASFAVEEMWHSGHERDVDKDECPEYDKFTGVLKDLGAKAKAVTASSEPWAEIDGVTFHIFRPSSSVRPDKDKTEEEKRAAIHNECMVLKVSFGGKAVMLTGDSTKAAWQSIMKHYNKDELLKADVLHASHHGSRTFFKKGKDEDAYTEHVDAIEPNTVVISVGEENGHEHPHDDAMDIYDDGGRDIFRTDENLTVVLTIDENGNMTWKMDDEDFQSKYELPDPDNDEDNDDGDGGRGRRKKEAVKAHVVAGASRTRLPDKNIVA